MSNFTISRVIDGQHSLISLRQNNFFNRKISIMGTIDDNMAQSVTDQLMYLYHADPGADITICINSTGGSVTAGLAIYDVMQHIGCDVATVCTGMAASMGAFLLAAGTAGKRYAMPNSEIMIHQPLGGFQGQTTDIKIHADRIVKTRAKLNRLLADMTGQTIKVITKDTERDNFMDAQQAVKYGIIDHIVQPGDNIL